MTLRFFPLLILAALACPVVEAEQGLDTALAGADILLDTVKNAERSKVQFSGQTTFKDEELRAAIAEQIREIDEKASRRRALTMRPITWDRFIARRVLRKSTRPMRSVARRVTIKIVEGPRSLLRKVTFTGNNAIPTPQLYEYMIGATPERMEKQPQDFPFNASEIASGADRVRGLYVSEGYLDVVVDASTVATSADGSRAEVVVKIEEHGRYTFGDITFAGETIFPREALLKALVEPVDGPFSRTKVTNTTRNLQSFYKAHGYYTAEVTVEADPKLAVNGRVAVKYTVTPRDIYRFGGVRVDNQTKPKPRLQGSFLPKRFAHLAGETYDPAQTRRDLPRDVAYRLVHHAAPQPSRAAGRYRAARSHCRGSQGEGGGFYAWLWHLQRRHRRRAPG
jgi:outer membrane protein assembly factor BamA